jgi:hypothetical protein
MGIAATARAANDWVVLGLINAGVSAGTAGAVWLFGFKSQKAQVNCTYGFAGFGLGLGIGLLPVDAAQPQNGDRIYGRHDFSAGDLDGADGTVINEGGDIYGWSFGKLLISASDARSAPYFSFQLVPGPNSGLGIDASCVRGSWKLLSLRDTKTGQFWNAF